MLFPKDGPWTEARKDEFATRVFDVIEEYAPGFKDSILHYEILTPPDLEREFSLPKGNIFHGSMGLDQVRIRGHVRLYLDLTEAVATVAPAHGRIFQLSYTHTITVSMFSGYTSWWWSDGCPRIKCSSSLSSRFF